MKDVWQLYKEEKRKYLDKVQEARAKGLMTEEEADRAMNKLHIRVTQEVSRRLEEQARERVGS